MLHTSRTIGIALSFALTSVSPLWIAAQNHDSHHQLRYRLVDVGTLGGPSSSVLAFSNNLNKDRPLLTTAPIPPSSIPTSQTTSIPTLLIHTFSMATAGVQDALPISARFAGVRAVAVRESISSDLLQASLRTDPSILSPAYLKSTPCSGGTARSSTSARWVETTASRSASMTAARSPETPSTLSLIHLPACWSRLEPHRSTPSYGKTAPCRTWVLSEGPRAAPST